MKYYINCKEKKTGRIYGTLLKNGRFERYFGFNEARYFSDMKDAISWIQKHKPCTGEEYTIGKWED